MKRWLALWTCIILLGGFFITAQAQTPDPQTPTLDTQTQEPVIQTETPAVQGLVTETPTETADVQVQPTDNLAAETQTPMSEIQEQLTQGIDIPVELKVAFEAALSSNPDNIAPLPFEPFIDNVTFSFDGKSALLWLGFRDTETGEVIAGEPGLAFANLSSAANQSLDLAGWTVTLPSSPDWQTTYQSLPAELTSPEIEMYAGLDQSDAVQSSEVYSGYKLPWAAGESIRLSGSIWHVWGYGASCPTTCRWAYDFAGKINGDSMFPLLAAKGGSIYAAKDFCVNGSTTCTNYLVIKDESTSTPTYQIYMHLKQNSIPVALKNIGTPVLQGQFIGNADDTGNSTGSHLHFHVTTTIYLSYKNHYDSYGNLIATDYYHWGPSVDITFNDVPINGGRPRTCDETTWAVDDPYDQCISGDAFISGNYGANPPSAYLFEPEPGTIITNGNLHFDGVAQDDVGVTKAQAILRINGAWKLAGTATILEGKASESYKFDLNLCDIDVSSGSLEVAVRVWDYEGNASIDPQSQRTVTNKTFCVPDPPACQPSASQVAIYSGANYTGSCKILGVGDYSSASAFAPVADNSLSSLLVGSSVQALLYDDTNFADRSETIVQNDPNLADNRLGAKRVTSIRVAARTLAIAAPTLTTPSNLLNVTPTSVDSLVLDWAAPGAISFQSTLSGPLSLTQDWTDSNGWSVGSLPAGDYTWTVNAKTVNGAIASASSSFTVAGASLPTANALGVPATQIEDMSGWSATNAGLWHMVKGYTLDGRTANAWVYNDGTDVGSSTVGASDLTSPPFTVPGGKSWLAFDYNTMTESDTAYWDQRWVQISVDDGRFENLLQLSGERMDTWLSSPWIDLSPYAGKSVRLRFHFDIVDKHYNGTLPEGGVVRGWVIDNVRVFSQNLPGCAESSNETAAAATAISVGAVVQGVICAAGDVDYYRFSASEGQWIDTQISANGADLELALLDLDQRSVLESSSEDIEYYVRAAGVYYLRVRAAAHPGEGGAADTYNLSTSDLAPVSQLMDLPAETNSTAVLLQWSASASVYGIDHFELEVDAGNDGSWVTLDGALSAGARSYWFIGQPGVTYGFRIRVIDRGGNVEDFPSGAEAVTHLAASCSGDGFENGDDASSGAAALAWEQTGESRNLCASNDADWYAISAPAGTNAITIRSISGGAAVKLSLYKGNTLVATAQSGGLGKGTAIYWKAASAGNYLVKVEPLRADLFGTDMRYTLSAVTAKITYLPVIGKN